MTRSHEFNHFNQNTIEFDAVPIDRGEVLLQIADLAMREQILREAATKDDVESMHDWAKVRRQMKLAQYTLDHSPLTQAA